MLAFGITTHGGVNDKNGDHIVEFADNQIPLELLLKESLKLLIIHFSYDMNHIICSLYRQYGPYYMAKIEIY